MRDAAGATTPDREVLARVFGFHDYRPGQGEIVAAMLAGEDVLAIMPTGGGKSLCYQLPALVGGRLTVVISPLIALMQDQVAALRENGVTAAALSSATAPDERDWILDVVREGRLRLLYIAPERLASERFCDWLAGLGIARLAVDEAHCISQWGHDFRPDYLRLGELAARLGVPVGAFTATADEDTRAEIVRRLFAGRRPRSFIRGFDRPNLSLAFQPKASPRRQVLDFVAARPGQSGIVYCATRDRAEGMAAALREAGVDALTYHAGLDADERTARQTRFTRGEGVVMAATVAFGMGVDKPDVRFVVQADLPKSIEAYYQEIGRAGRDGLPADTLTLYGADDIRLARARIDEGDAPPERKRADHARLSALLALAEAPACRRQTLLAYFGEAAGPCGNCDLCREPPERIDGTEIAQMALSAMLRTGEGFGAGHVVAVLRGEADDRIRRLGHDQIRTFGVGAAHGRGDWQAWLRQMLALGLCTIDGERGGAWRVTEAGWEVLRGTQPVELKRETPARKAAARKGALPAPRMAPEDEALLRALKARRAELAREANVPAYVVFSDRSLIEMAARRPATPSQMGEVHGVGAAKLERYGDTFLAVIREAG
ncbi:DNA helicase RecQ [Limibaculum sp. FT325]|uniref:DNA helicase RecQ n=1 Tax=Thermohalobaculum sediminis TaxID=2939436 RepID=UPI0020C03814|nr:DNA helicase RecQ [Limibaculum sediminis]MCL5778782.1 DNA helicase RecQ [Limibaculum sediminis]